MNLLSKAVNLRFCIFHSDVETDFVYCLSKLLIQIKNHLIDILSFKTNLNSLLKEVLQYCL